MENPFRYGVVVDDPYFTGRQEEIRQIHSDLVAGNNLIMISPRRYGKTSLIKKSIHQLESEGFPVVYLDFFRINDLKQFMDHFAAQVLNKQQGLKKSLNVFQKWIRGIRPSVTLDPSGNPSFSFSHDPAIPAYESLSDILNLPSKVIANKRWIVVFDEFQDIEKFNGTETEKRFRSVMQFQTQISYALLGSKTHLLNQMFSLQDRAFYGFGKMMRIDKIDPEAMKSYIVDRMSQGGISCSPAYAEMIIGISDNIPYYVQFLASESWSGAQKINRPVNREVIEQAVGNILVNQQDHFHQLTDGLSSYQKKVLGAIAVESEQIFSLVYMKKYDLGAVSSTQRATERLINAGILEKANDALSFANPFFRRYIQNLVAPGL